MITFKNLGFLGRLGNQMFQYAALHAVAKKLNYQYGIPIENTNNSSEYQRLCLMDGFELDLNSHSIPPGYFNSKTFNYTDAVYNSNIFNISDDTDLYGYFQSPKYFEHCVEDIKTMFKFKSIYNDKCDKFLQSLGPTHLTSLHIRRTDYVENDGIFETPISSFSHVVKKLPNNGVILVYSDDVPWCKLFLPKVIKYNLLFPCDIIGTDKFIDMCSMTKMHVNIIANSTFSWWGAYLNNNSKVYIPQKWYKNDDHSVEFYVDCWEKF
jgi:hypothetical protein